MTSALVPPDSAVWAQTLARLPHDLYHLPAYARLEARDPAASPVAFRYERGGRLFFLPLILRAIPDSERVDAISPYGYPGPLGGEGEDEDFQAEASRALVERLREAGAVTAFVRLHPILSPPAAGLRAAGPLVQHGETVTIDLSLSEEEMWRQIRPGHRSEIRRAGDGGLEVERDHDWSGLEEFVAVYRATMRRVGADAAFFFGRDYFESLRREFDDAVSLWTVRRHGALICGGIFSAVGGIVQYHLSGTHPDHLGRNPSKLMLDRVRRWAKSRGLRHFHLGGGVGARRDALFRFKAGFSKRRLPFYTWRLVVDPGEYRRLNRERHPAPPDPAGEGFFPAYRRPRPAGG